MEAAAWVPRAGVGLMLEVACNDETCGAFAYRAAEIQIGIIELEPKNWMREPRFFDLGDRIRLSGKVWPVIGSVEYFGNWCWTAYTLGDGQEKTERWWLTDFAIWLRGRGLFSITQGHTEFYGWWEKERDATRAEVHGWICDALEERYQ